MGGTTTYNYNALNQLTERTDAAGIVRNYTPSGQRQTETKGNAVKTYVYNASDRLAQIK